MRRIVAGVDSLQDSIKSGNYGYPTLAVMNCGDGGAHPATFVFKEKSTAEEAQNCRAVAT
jgi:hypothetical protein